MVLPTGPAFVEYENLVFGGSTVQHRHLLLSLVVTLLLSALASANPIALNMTSLHSSVYSDARIDSSHFSASAAKTSPTIFAAFSNRVSGLNDNARLGESFPGAMLRSQQPASYRIPPLIEFAASCCKGQNRLGGPAQSESTPEPGSLMLLATGLIGIAGVVRRKLTRS